MSERRWPTANRATTLPSCSSLWRVAVAASGAPGQAQGGHTRGMRGRRPHLPLKLAISADRKAGLAGGRPAPITGEPARDRVHLMRAMNDAVLTGIGTVLADDPLLTCRLPGMEARSPVRVVLDSALRLPAGSKLANSATRTLDWVFVDENAKPDHEATLTQAGVAMLGG